MFNKLTYLLIYSRIPCMRLSVGRPVIPYVLHGSVGPHEFPTQTGRAIFVPKTPMTLRPDMYNCGRRSLLRYRLRKDTRMDQFRHKHSSIGVDSQQRFCNKFYLACLVLHQVQVSYRDMHKRNYSPAVIQWC